MSLPFIRFFLISFLFIRLFVIFFFRWIFIFIDDTNNHLTGYILYLKYKILSYIYLNTELFHDHYYLTCIIIDIVSMFSCMIFIMTMFMARITTAFMTRIMMTLFVTRIITLFMMTAFY